MNSPRFFQSSFCSSNSESCKSSGFEFRTLLLIGFSLAFIQFSFGDRLWAQTAGTAQAVATVNSKPITLQEFKKRYEDVKRETLNPPPPEIFLEDLVRYEIGVQEAERQKLQEDEIVKERFRQEMYKALLERSLSKKVDGIKISENEMKAYYQKNPEIRSSHILIEVKPGATPAEKAQSKQRADEIYGKVKGSKQPFEELVKLYTDDTLSRSVGGDINWQSRVTLFPTYYEAALKLKIGEVFGLVETRYGFHILKLTGKRAFSEANRLQIRAAVFDEKRKEIFNQYFKELKKNYKVTTNEALLKNLK